MGKLNTALFSIQLQASELKAAARTGRILGGHEVVEQQHRSKVQHCRACTLYNHNGADCVGCIYSTHNAGRCPSFPALQESSAPAPALAPVSSTQLPLPLQPPPLSQASPAPWIIPSGPGFVQNTQSATQNWVFGPGSGSLGMILGAGYPASSQGIYGGPYYSQGGHLQVPETQYSQFQ
jgi:hypothetical protein